MIRVSIIIPAFKAEAWIERSVNSVIERKSACDELIVVVDGVYDQTEAIVSKIDGVTLLVNQENKGSQYARNQGLAVAKGRYVSFLDCDDYFVGHYIDGLVNAAEANSADMTFGRIAFISEEGLWDYKVQDSIDARVISDELLERCTWATQGGCVLWNRDFINSIGAWNVSLKRWQDTEIVLRGLCCGQTFSKSETGYLAYIQHASFERISVSGNPSDRPREYLDMLNHLVATVNQYNGERQSKILLSFYNRSLYRACRWAISFEQWDLARECIKLTTPDHLRKGSKEYLYSYLARRIDVQILEHLIRIGKKIRTLT